MAKGEKLLEEELYILLQPTRRRILQALKSSPPMYIEELAKSVGEDRKNIVFHLMTLREYGVVDYELGIIETPKSVGKAGKFYKLTEKGIKAAKLIDRLFEEYSK